MENHMLEVLSLATVRPALCEDTIVRLPTEALAASLATAVEKCDNQLLAVLVRELEDFENAGDQVREADLRAALNAIIAAGEQRLGRDLFWALINEYE
jgi:hypothetical protein